MPLIKNRTERKSRAESVLQSTLARAGAPNEVTLMSRNEVLRVLKIRIGGGDAGVVGTPSGFGLTDTGNSCSTTPGMRGGHFEEHGEQCDT